MTVVKAVVSVVVFCGREFEGLMMPDGSFAMAASQVASLFQVTQNYASQTFKRLLGNDFRSHKIATEINKAPVNVFSLDMVERLATELAFSGNELAKDFVRDSVGLTLVQSFSDAFGVKFDKEERKAWGEARLKTRKQHQPCVTDHWAKVDGIESGLEYAIRTKTLKAACGIKTTVGVNDMSQDQLVLWSMAQSRYGNARELGLGHKDALEFVKKIQKW